MKEMFW